MQKTFPCPGCGVQIPVGQKACGACGEEFEYRCVHCGAVAKTVSKFCTSCGGVLHQPTQLLIPSPEMGRGTYQEAEETGQKKTSPPPSRVWLYAFLGFIAIALYIGAILYAGGGSQGNSSTGHDGWFIFGGVPPALAPTSPPSTGPGQEPASVPYVPRYIADEVITLAESFSPDCRVVASGGG